MPKNYLWGIIIFLTIVNGFSFYKQKKINDNAKEVIYDSSLDNYIAATFKNTNRVILFGENIVKSLPKKKNDSKINFYFLFRDIDCTNCITETWEMIEGLVKNTYLTESNINYYFYSDNVIDLPTLLEYNNLNIKQEDIIDFNYEKILLESDITISPLLIVTNFGSVIDAYQPEPGNLVTRDAFWKKWQQILTVMQ